MKPGDGVRILRGWIRWTDWQEKHINDITNEVDKLEADRREAIIEQLSESELAKDVTRLEAENEALRELLGAGYPSIEEYIDALLTREKPETPLSDVPITP